MSDASALRPLSTAQRAALAALGFRDPTIAPLDTGWGRRVGVLLVRDAERQVVLKRIEVGGGSRGSLVRRWARRIAMRREIDAYRAMARRDWSYLRHPDLLATDGRTYLVLSYVEASPRWPSDVTDRAVHALLDLQLGLAHEGRRDLTQLLRPRAPWRILVRAARNDFGRRERSTVGAMRVAIRCSLAIARARLPRLAQHGDATFGNLIVTRQGDVGFVDLERVRFADRLHYADAVQLATSLRSAEGIDASILREYAAAWCRATGRSRAEADPQLRLALLLHVLYVIHAYEAPPAFRLPFERFLPTVLSDAAFRTWADGAIWPRSSG